MDYYKCKIIYGNNVKSIEKQLNDFLSEKDIKIVSTNRCQVIHSIQQSYFEKSVSKPYSSFELMIIYKENKT